jgi:hypothetical protein
LKEPVLRNSVTRTQLVYHGLTWAFDASGSDRVWIDVAS